ncbi:MAG: SusC/RagA family TonB-linked outer membrane protein, partial [Chitinophagaceae bacterium]
AFAYAQKSITGKVTNKKDGSPLPGVSVIVKDGGAATQTDLNGNFSLVNVPANSKLIFSFVSFKTFESPLPSGNTMNINLEEETQQLSEVVVTALGIRRTDRGLGYSIAKVDPEGLLQKSEPDVLKSLQGKVAGVDIRSSQGTPGAATRIQIRGNNSFFGNSQPLIVVDGIPYSNDQVTTTNQATNGGAYSSGIANLDPNDIASMSVLKGSSAAALYGSRASNGVLVITTKSGSAKKTKGTEISLKSSVSTETIANLPDYQNEYGAGSQLAYSNANGSWGPAFRTRDSIPAWPTLRAAYPELFPSANVAYRPYPNNVKDLFRRGYVFENSISATGGNEKSSVGVTASHVNHKGYVLNSSYNRANVGLGASTRLDIGVNISGNFSYARSRQEGGFFGENQLGGAAPSFARSLFLARNWDLNLPFEDKNGLPLQPNVTGYDNPKWSAKYNFNHTNEERIVAGVHADFNISKWIRVDYTFGSNVSLLDRREVTEIGSRAAEGLGRLVLDDYRKQELESNFLVTFSPRINNDVNLKVILGNNVNQRTITNTTQTGNQFITKGVHALKNTSQQQFTEDFYSRQRIIGAFADVSVGYKNFAYLNGTVRNDWSSTLPIENRSYLYPSVSGTFVFTDALKIKSNTIDFGKIRAGWAKVGRDADPYSLEDVYNINPNFLGINSATLPSTANSADLKPEFTTEIEIGGQLSFFKRKVELDLAWYDRESTNLIASITTPASSGYGFKVTNFGSISNEGVEVDLTVRPIKTKDFNWEIHGVFTKNKNIVTKLTSGVDRIQAAGIIDGINPYFEPGLPYGYLRGTVSARDEEGNLLIDPVTGWIIQSDAEQMVGNPNPDYKMGVTNTFSYKGFSLNVLWDMTKGGDMYSVTLNTLLGRGVTKDIGIRETSWIIPGVYGDPNDPGKALLENGKKIPNHTVITTNDLYFSAGGPSGSFGINSSTEWQIYDATVYRLREITLGYDLPKSVFGKSPIKGINISLSGRNLWYLAPKVPKYTNFDPEVNSFGSTNVQGIELSAAPTTRRFGFNVNVKF